MFKFEFSLEDTNKILGALGKAPFEFVADLIANIREQAAPQVEAVNAANAAAAAVQDVAEKK